MNGDKNDNKIKSRKNHNWYGKGSIKITLRVSVIELWKILILLLI